LWLHSLKVAQLLRSAACLYTNQSRSYLNHLVLINQFANTISHNVYFLRYTTVIKKYCECCCRVWSNGKAGIFNTGSSGWNLSNSVWQVSTCLVQSVDCELRL